MTEGGGAPRNDMGEGVAPSPPRHSELPPVIPNGVRNLRSPSEDRSVPLMTYRVGRHLRFFVVRSSE